MTFNFILLVALVFLCTIIITEACSHTFQNCGVGCWNENGVVLPNGLRICAPVGEGYFSANNNNSRTICPKGTFSGELEAEECSICPSGSASGDGSAKCTLCPPGSFQELPGQSTCRPCSPAIFSGAGSNTFDYDMQSDTLFCALNGVSPVPSTVSSKSPTSSPSTNLTELPVPSQEPSPDPSPSSTTPTSSTAPPPDDDRYDSVLRKFVLTNFAFVCAILLFCFYLMLVVADAGVIEREDTMMSNTGLHNRPIRTEDDCLAGVV